MFEVIGIIVVAWVLWKVFKGVVNGGLNGTLARACDYAQNLGVPNEFATEIIKHSDVITGTRKDLSKTNKEFAMLDVYEQYGHTIAALYEEECRRSGISADTMNKVRLFLQPQIKQLKSEGIKIQINDITYVYLGALATYFAKTAINIQQIYDLVKYVFPEDEFSFSIDNGYNMVRMSSDFIEKMNDIVPVVNDEIRLGKGVFFVKYTKKANQEMDRLFTERVDIGEPTRVNFLDL